MNKRKSVLVGAALLVLAACGPADVNTSASQAASAAASAVGAAGSAAGTAGGSAIASAAGAAASTAASAAAGVDTSAAASAAASLAGAVGIDPSAAASAAGSLAGAAGSLAANVAPSELKLQRDQPLVLSTTAQVAGVTNYRWTIAQVPAGGESVQGDVIAENSDGKLTIDPADYAKYFPVSGTYTVNLDLTSASGTTTQPIPVIVP